MLNWQTSQFEVVQAIHAVKVLLRGYIYPIIHSQVPFTSCRKSAGLHVKQLTVEFTSTH